MREITPLLQIRQVAHLRSTTCNLQGLSPTQRSTQTTPSRDLTLGGKAREPPQTISPEVCSSPPGKTERRGTLSDGFATMCEGHRTHESTTMSFIAPCCKRCCPVARAEMLESHSSRDELEARERSWGSKKVLFLGESLRPGSGRKGAGRERGEDPGQAQQEQVEQSKKQFLAS